MSNVPGWFYQLNGDVLRVAPPVGDSADQFHTLRAWTNALSDQQNVPRKLVAIFEIPPDDRTKEALLEDDERLLDFTKY